MIDEGPVKGRGAQVNVHNRFQAQERGIFEVEGVDVTGEGPTATTYLPTFPRSILNRVESPDLPFAWTLNPYQGCEHGCSYCYARPTHEYWGYSAGLDFERVVLVKQRVPELLVKALGAPSWKGEPIMISGATDPYQPIERKEVIMRRVLQVMLDHGQAVSVITKNALVLRDVDLLGALAQQGLASVAISLTTLDEDLRRVLEPRTSSGIKRLKAIETLSKADVPVHVMVAPIIPALNEAEVPALLKAASEAGARSAGYTVLRTNGAVEPVFRSWLHTHYPDRAAKVIAQTSALHGGRMNDSRTGTRMKGEGPYAANIARLFDVMRSRYFGDARLPPLDRTRFKVPPTGQLDLFR
jgi:DNA repair photolyase